MTISGARHGLNLSGKLQRIAEQEKALLEKLKTNRSEVFKAPAESTLSKQARKRPLVELNSSKDESSSDESELPINLESNKKASKSKKKKDKKEVNHLANIIESIGIDRNLPKQTDTPVHQDTPIKKKKDKLKTKSKESEDLNKIIEEIEQIGEDRSKKKKKKKAKKRNLNDDDDEIMPTIEADEKSKNEDENHLKAKRAKLDGFVEDSNSESDADIDKINEIHHINLHNNKLASAEAPKSKNLESSLKKKKKKKGKDKVALTNDDSWKLQTTKKMEKYEQKKQKQKLKLEKLSNHESRNLSKKAKKKLRKEEKKRLAELTDTVITEINSVGF